MFMAATNNHPSISKNSVDPLLSVNTIGKSTTRKYGDELAVGRDSGLGGCFWETKEKSRTRARKGLRGSWSRIAKYGLI